ncbi:MAG: histidinol-phosphatase [Victivallales bacterium]
MLLDYHVHTFLCKHATGIPDEYVDAAIRNGISEMGFSDHCPWPFGFDPKCRMKTCEFHSYRQIVSDLKEKHEASIKVKFGLEVDWVPGRMDEVFRNLDNEDFDYLIGSVHYTDEFPFDNPDFVEKWREKGVADNVWHRYFDLILQMVESGKFNIIGHLDLPKKFGYYPASMDKINKLILKVFTVASENNMAIELNTSGLRKPVREIYPSLEILKLAGKCNLMITLGSDSHAPNEVAANFADAVSLAKSAGYTHICSFEKRMPKLQPIG